MKKFLTLVIIFAFITLLAGCNDIKSNTNETTPDPIETSIPTESVESDTTENDAPETTAPETDSPETAIHETDAPETDAPEAEAPETDVPETTAPETEAPETEPAVEVDPADSVTVLSNPGGLKFSTITIPSGWLSIHEFDSEHMLIMTYDVETGERGRITATTDIRFYLINTLRGELVATLEYGRAEGHLNSLHHEQDALVRYALELDEETETYSVTSAIRIEHKNGKLIVTETEKSAFPYREEKLVSPDGRYTVYSTKDDGSSHGGIDVLYPDGTTKRILTNVMLDDPCAYSVGGVTGYSPVQFIDNDRLLYHIGGWEWSKGYGIYNLTTGEKTEFLNGYGAMGYADGYIYLKDVSQYEVIAWYRATLDGEIEKIASVAKDDGALYVPNAREFTFGGTDWRDMYSASSNAHLNDTSVLNTTIYSLDGETVLANVTYNCTGATIYVISHGNCETAIVFDKNATPPEVSNSGETDAPETDPAFPVTVLSNPGGLDVHTVVIPAQIRDYQAFAGCFKYDDRYVLCMTHNYHYDEEARKSTRSNFHLYVIDVSIGEIIHSQPIDCTDRPTALTYSPDGGVLLSGGPYYEDTAEYDAIAVYISDGNVSVSETKMAYYPRYNYKATSPDGKYTAYGVYDDASSRGGVDIYYPDGTVKRIRDNRALEDAPDTGDEGLDYFRAYIPVGFLDEKHLALYVGGYSGALTYEIYNVETGETTPVYAPGYKTGDDGEQYFVRYNPVIAIDGWLYLTNHEQRIEGNPLERCGVSKVDLSGNFVEVAHKYDTEGVFALPLELTWMNNSGSTWEMYAYEYNHYSKESEEYFKSMNHRINKTIYSADFDLLLEIEYPFFYGAQMEDVYIYESSCTVITFAER